MQKSILTMIFCHASIQVSHVMRQQERSVKSMNEVSVNRLKGKVVAEGMTPETLAEAIGCDKSTIYRAYKNPNKITIGMALKIKEALNMSDTEAIEIFLV